MTKEEFVTKSKYLYHLSCGDAWDSIRRHGLKCAQDVFKSCGIVSDQRLAVYGERKLSNKHFHSPDIGQVVVRDQKPLCWKGIRKAVEPELTPLQWIDLLNQRVFFWVRETDVKGLIDAASYRNTTNTMLKFHARDLLDSFWEKVEVTTFNVGYTMRKPKKRGRDSFVHLADYVGGHSKIRELTISSSIGDVLPYLECVNLLGSEPRVRYSRNQIDET